MLTVNEFAKAFRLTYPAPNLQKEDIIEACNIAKKYHVNAVNVNSCWGELVVEELKEAMLDQALSLVFRMARCARRQNYLNRRW